MSICPKGYTMSVSGVCQKTGGNYKRGGKVFHDKSVRRLQERDF